MNEAKHDHAGSKVTSKDLEPMAKAPPEKPEPSRAAAQAKPEKEKPKSLHQKLADLMRRVELAFHSPVANGKAEEFADCWDELDGMGDGGNAAEAAMIQAAHNHLQHHAPRHASQLDSLEAQLEAAHKQDQKPQAKPDTPQLAAVKQRIADKQTELANDPRALPEDVERVRQLGEKVTNLQVEKSTK